MRGSIEPRRHVAAVIAAAAAACCGGAFAQPVGPSVVFGGAQVQQLGHSMLVTTSNGAGSNRSVIDWRSFSVPAGSVTHFQQPGVDSMSINRVTGNKPSQIFGTLSSNGQLVLVNPAGIAVGKGAVIDTAGFTASALSLSDDDAIAGRLRFAAGHGKASVDVEGTVLARAGDVVLLGTDVQVDKEAVLSAPGGAVILAAGQRVSLTGRGLEGIVLELAAPQDRAVNLGRLEGDAVGIFASQLRHTGVIQASHVILQGDKVRLEKGGPKDKDNSGNGNNAGNGGNPGNGNGNSSGGTDSGSAAPPPPPPPPPSPSQDTASDPDVVGTIDTTPPPPAPPAGPPPQSGSAAPAPAPAPGASEQAQTILSVLVSHDSETIMNNGAVIAGLQAPTLSRDSERRPSRTQSDSPQQCTP